LRCPPSTSFKDIEQLLLLLLLLLSLKPGAAALPATTMEFATMQPSYYRIQDAMTCVQQKPP
jgi:hypothetical protein